MKGGVVGRLESPNKNDHPQTKRNQAQLAAILRQGDSERALVAILLEDGTYHVSVREKDMVVTLARGNVANP